MDNPETIEPVEARLLLEESSGTAVVEGARAELPPREFRLLSELARRPGEPVAADELVAAIWPDVTWDVSQELYVLVSRLRKLIGDERGVLLKNRRGFGYYLALPAHEVVVAKTLEAVRARRVAEVGPVGDGARAANRSADRLNDAPTTPIPRTFESTPFVPMQSPAATRRTPGARRVATSVAVSLGLVVGSSAAGVVLSRPAATPRAQSVVRAPEIAPPPTSASGRLVAAHPRSRSDNKQGREPSDRNRKKTGTKPRPRIIKQILQEPVAAAIAAQPMSYTERDAGSRSVSRQRSEPERNRPGPKPKPNLPPAPTTYLYHLVSPEGAHFVTTNPSQATSYQNRGWRGSAIGRVYSSPQPGTARISTDFETAYIFNRPLVNTSPESVTTALYYSTNGKSDFFYTTDQSEANQSGWSGSHIGYIRV